MVIGTENTLNSDTTFRTDWYALHTRHRHEKVVAQALSTKGFSVFLPLYTAVRCWRDQTRKLCLPLFPCYVFLRWGLERRLEIVTTPAVHGFVEFAGRPAVIPEAEIDGVRRMVESSLRVEPHPLLKSGYWVRIKYGPLAGIEGILVRKKNLFRLVLTVEMLGRSVAVEVESSMVERVTNRNVEWFSQDSIARTAGSANRFAVVYADREQRAAR